jgi:hypothetical protein
MGYEEGHSKSYNHGVPTTSQTGDPGFMQGYRDGEASRQFQATQVASTAISWPNRSDETQVAASQPSEPFTLLSPAKGFATAGVVVGLLYAFFALNAQPIAIATYAIGGLLAGSAAGILAWIAVKIIQFVLWLLVWAVKIGAVLALVYFALQYFSRQ